MLGFATLLGSALAAPTTAAPALTTTTTAATVHSSPMNAALSDALQYAPASAGSTPSRLNKNMLFAKFLAALRAHGMSSASVRLYQQQRLHKRHSKRHSVWYEDYNENSTIVEWQNPCGGEYEELTVRPRRKNPKQFYKILKLSATDACKTLNTTRHHIREKDVEMWSLHNSTYKFLPKLKANSRIALIRWHRNMQTYVASFAYLRREQLKWDHYKSQRESVIAQELKELLFSSRNILCELETAVNGTQTRSSQRLRQFSRSEMNRRLKLNTKRRSERFGGVAQEADAIDLVYVKHYYLDFLQKMRDVLREKTKRRGQMALSMGSASSAANRREYNEVEKRRSSDSRSKSAAMNSNDDIINIGIGDETNAFAFADDLMASARTTMSATHIGTAKRHKANGRRVQAATLPAPLHGNQYVKRQQQQQQQRQRQRQRPQRV